ncbi:arrestin domain-containing protein 17-like [Ruditapes philippinarum]|uniref:arrestin domain-containing protein 17-like n=1 Tax=Ruditapes philippinarum TaxID=129788 RepID=UPI00295C3377|nr:arrestin domain-containing protein 17-like [Ruditapes philippinarum]
MKLTHFQIQFDNPHGVFAAGEKVSGQIMLNLAKPMKMRSLKVLLVGEGKSHWSKRRGKTTVHYRGSETYLNALIVLFEGDSQSGNKEHPAGSHAYPFSVQLHANLPSSFEGTRGHVRYVCKCTIDRPWKFDSHTKRAFTVIHHVDLNYLQQAPIPLDGQTRQDIEGCCCSAGSVEASLSLNKTGYVPGEPIVFDILVDNQSDYRINQVELILTQVKYVVLSYDNVQSPDYTNLNPVQKKQTYRESRGAFLSSGHPKNSPKTASFSLLHYNCNIKQRTSERINRATLVPSLPPSGLEGCGIIDIAYTVELKVPCSGSKLKILKKIILGTIPLQEPTFQVPVQPSAPSLQHSPSGPVTVQPQSVNLNIDPLPQPPSYEEALAPPPAYSECVYGRTLIRDAGDDDHTTGDTNWAPAYPYYDWSTLPYRGQRPEVATAGPPQYDND